MLLALRDIGWAGSGQLETFLPARTSVVGTTSAGGTGGYGRGLTADASRALRPDAGWKAPDRRGPAEIRHRSSDMSESKFLPLPQSVLPLAEGPGATGCSARVSGDMETRPGSCR